MAILRARGYLKYLSVRENNLFAMVECTKTRKWHVGLVGGHWSFGMRPQIWSPDGPKTMQSVECEGSCLIDIASRHLRWPQFLQTGGPFEKIPIMTILRVYGTPQALKMTILSFFETQIFVFLLVIFRSWGYHKHVKWS
jgi:hypothetical protein